MIEIFTYKLLGTISTFFSFLPLVIAIVFYKPKWNYLTPIYSVIIVSAFVELLNYFLVKSGTNNFLVIRIYTILELTSISLFYFLFYKQYLKSRFLLTPIPVFILVACLDYSINGIDHFDNYATAFEALCFSIISLWSFFYVIQKMLFKSIANEPFFWINTGVLLYFGGNLILFLFSEYLFAHENSNQIALWTIHSVLNILYNIILAIGFWKTKRR